MPIRPENRDRYPANWPQIRAAMLDRATEDPIVGPRCECLGECGRGTHEGRCPNLQGAFAYQSSTIPSRRSRVVLTIAHLDHTPEHNDPANLRAMCQGCHLHYDAEHHAETRRRARERAGQLTLTPPEDTR